MARVSKGNSLATPVLQPGWTIEDDGFGLLTCSATFKANHGTSGGTPGLGAAALKAAPARGAKFPRDERLTCHRASSVMDANGIQVITADYVGIAKGTQTEVQVTGGFRSNQEPIATHPAFIKFGGRKDAPINGASFNDSDNSFKRFADPEYSEWHGVTSYLSPGFSINGHFYTKDVGALPALKDAMGTTSSTGVWAGYNLVGPIGILAATVSWNTVPKFMVDLTILAGRNESGPIAIDIQRNTLLLTGISVEYFGDLMKVSYDISFSQDGWNDAIYNERKNVKPAKAPGKKWDGKGTLGLGAAFNATRSVFGR